MSSHPQKTNKEYIMNQGITTVVYPVKDIVHAKAQFKALLGVEPYADEAYYVGFKVGGLDIGLDPNGHKNGMTVYYQVDDIKESLQSLLDSGAQVLQDVKDVGGGKLIAFVKDSDGNIIGLTQ
jgi:predicted enzyme related to lactoylglutathione lyase